VVSTIVGRSGCVAPSAVVLLEVFSHLLVALPWTR
jgi:hypothetical protein